MKCILDMVAYAHLNMDWILLAPEKASTWKGAFCIELEWRAVCRSSYFSFLSGKEYTYLLVISLFDIDSANKRISIDLQILRLLFLHLPRLLLKENAVHSFPGRPCFGGIYFTYLIMFQIRSDQIRWNSPFITLHINVSDHHHHRYCWKLV